VARAENLLGAVSLTLADRLRSVGAGQGLSASEQAAVVTLHAHPDQAVSWLGEVLGLTSSGMTRLVDRLVERGWVVRSPGTDARQRRLRLTGSGTKRARMLQREQDEVLGAALATLSGRDRADLEGLLGRLVGDLAVDYLPAVRTCRLCDRDACRASAEPCPLDHTIPADV
jgi:DNA-binding MarR family transcriptional regulator